MELVIVWERALVVSARLGRYGSRMDICMYLRSPVVALIAGCHAVVRCGEEQDRRYGGVRGP